MLIQNEWGGLGTGFVVARIINDKGTRLFLATNKHVLHEETDMREEALEIILHVNFKNVDGTIKGETAKIPLNLDDGSKRWREHPDRDVDVLAFDITALKAQYSQLETKWVKYDLFGTSGRIKQYDITIGEDILVIGYPLGLRHAETNYPLVRAGIIATRIGECLEDEVKKKDGTYRKRQLRGFLIDGGAIPGSSGSRGVET